MNKYIDILKQVLSGKYTSGKYDIETNGTLTFDIKLVKDRITVLFRDNRPTVSIKFILRIRLPINSIEILDDMIYVYPDGWKAVPISIKDLSNAKTN